MDKVQFQNHRFPSKTAVTKEFLTDESARERCVNKKLHKLIVGCFSQQQQTKSVRIIFVRRTKKELAA